MAKAQDLWDLITGTEKVLVNLVRNNMLPMERDSYFYILLDG
jgi:hypothetical protein